YHMTGPAGDQPHGYWDVLEVEPPRRILFRAGCANADGTPHTDMPMSTIRVGIEEAAQGRTRLSIESVFPNTEAMEHALAMGTGEICLGANAYLLRRRTCESFAGAWGTWAGPGDSPIWTALNTKTKYVASTTLSDPQWADTTVRSGDVAAAIGELKAKTGREL